MTEEPTIDRLTSYLKELHNIISSPVLEIIVNEVLKEPELKQILEEYPKLQQDNIELQTQVNLLKGINSELKKPCPECNGSGRFYFTKENKFEDSQPCGKCNPEALRLARDLHTYEKLFKLLVNARPLKSDEANLTLDAKTVLKSLQLREKVKELVTNWKYGKYEECSIILHEQLLKESQ